MNMEVIDRSNYLKALLILIGKDKKITEHEKEMMLKFGDILGFDKKFCVNAINDLFENEYIVEEPPKFSNSSIAKMFIKDGIKLAFADHEMHLYELNWLKAVAERNGLDSKWCLTQFEDYKKAASIPGFNRLEVESYLMA